MESVENQYPYVESFLQNIQNIGQPKLGTCSFFRVIFIEPFHRLDGGKWLSFSESPRFDWETTFGPRAD